MSSICLIDTSILLNILDVPNRNKERNEIEQKFRECIELEMKFIIPMAVVVETGNHISQNGDGNTRRKIAEKFVETLKMTLNGELPFLVVDWDTPVNIRNWLDEFPTHAQRNKSPTRTGEGTSFGDLSIIKEFEKSCSKFPMTEIFIWSLDDDLKAYHQKQS
ncbi:hypothetical protein [Acinetobacter wuhouensis]|uniref:PIN domain-containing protein n=2 Tax=Acinetobacter wuhouensis TaxID=1879050 RepID=A0A4Q7AK32_9GAMM|nr:hypothetical protein [Acinetobacter wuhouensis]RZG43833.1 hypothetical protein EXU28_16525 [Acinetobacter wuhouensis]